MIQYFGAYYACCSDGDAIWIGDGTDKLFQTISDAVNEAGEGAVIYVKGNFSMNSAADIGKNITLDIVGNTMLTGSNGDGIILESGSHIRCSNGAELTMTGFWTALDVKSGAEINDGTYTFKENGNYNNGRRIIAPVREGNIISPGQLYSL